MRASLVAVWLVLFTAACGSATSRSHAPTRVPSRSTAGRNSFQGTVISATGAYAGEGGRAEVTVQTRGGGTRRPVKLAFRSLPCQGSPQCVQLDGTLAGTIEARARGVPDTGRVLTVSATGRLTTLGAVTAAGTAHGTGFIARGHELLDLTLINRSGRITLRGISRSVGGFSSP